MILLYIPYGNDQLFNLEVIKPRMRWIAYFFQNFLKCVKA